MVDRKRREAVDYDDILATGRYNLKKAEDEKRWWYLKAINEVPLRILESERTVAEDFLEKNAAVFDQLDKLNEAQIDKAVKGIGEQISFKPGEKLFKDHAGAQAKKASKKMTSDIKRHLAKGAVNFREKRKVRKYLAIFGGIAIGAAIGAVIGTVVFPVIGTAVGGAIGAAIAAVGGVTAGVLLGTLGGWLGLKASKKITKKTLPESSTHYKLFKRNVNELENITKLNPTELTKLSAFMRNREKSMPKGDKRTAIEFVRKRAFKKSSPQGVDHMVYFLVEEYKALEALGHSERSYQQDADLAFLGEMLDKLKESPIGLQARNHIRLEYAGEHAIFEPNTEELKAMNGMKSPHVKYLDQLVKQVKAYPGDVLVNQQGVANLSKQEVMFAIQNIIRAKNPIPVLKEVFAEGGILANVHDDYGLHIKVHELVAEQLMEEAREKHRTLRRHGKSPSQANVDSPAMTESQHALSKAQEAQALFEAQQAKVNRPRQTQLFMAKRAKFEKQSGFPKAQTISHETKNKPVADKDTKPKARRVRFSKD